jgi:ADP-ribose pyrophosphatase
MQAKPGRTMSDDRDDDLQHGWPVNVSNERVELPNGKTLLLDVVRHPGASAVVPFLSDDEVLLIRQYRHACDGTIFEVPAGKIDPGENPEQCAARELQEEVGRRAGRLESLGWIWTSPGFTDERIFLFAGFELDTVPSLPADDELIEPVIVPLAEALQCVWRGELTDAKSSIALIHAARRLGRLE